MQGIFSKRARSFDEAGATGTWDESTLGPKPQGWDAMSADDKKAYLSSSAGQQQRSVQLGTDPYNGPGGGQGYDPYSGMTAGGPPQAADLTDQLLQKTRTNFALRLQAGNNQQSSYGAQTGGLVLGGNKAGGY